MRAALQKLTRSPAVAKRIAAACHPDKCPPELSEVASELFRFVGKENQLIIEVVRDVVENMTKDALASTNFFVESAPGGGT